MSTVELREARTPSKNVAIEVGIQEIRGSCSS
jgi:hypothetical protein